MPIGQPFIPPDVSDPPFKPAREIDHWCKRCGKYFVSPHPRHFYCEPCSESQDLLRKKLFGRAANVTRRRDEKREVGREISKAHSRGMADPPHRPDLAWLLRISIPFSWSGSKNAIYALRRQGHVALRREASAYRDSLILALQAGLRGRKMIQNKLWIEIFVEKANHKGDAVNFVDTVCDAVKVATGLDDRWFCLRGVDWSICKDDPHLFVSIGQEDVEPAQPCSYCGRILPFSAFSSNKSNKSGIARICRDCSKKPVVAA